MGESPVRRVGCHLEVDVRTPARLILQVAVADPGPAALTETLNLTLDGQPVEPTVIDAPHGGRVHVLDSRPGLLVLDYDAVVTGRAAAPAVGPLDDIEYLRPSRYAEADRLGPVARAEFSGIPAGPDLLAAVTSWVGTRLYYVPGSSGPTDGAVDTLLEGQGVCRDYAHLVVALLRALDVPARLTAVYAPGLSPMDFHAVAEALIDGRWQVVDSTLLAPRQALLRISTGRDAADTAFLSNYNGEIAMRNQWVNATIDGPLPVDDVTELVQLG